MGKEKARPHRSRAKFAHPMCMKSGRPNLASRPKRIVKLFRWIQRAMSDRVDQQEKFDLREQARLNWDRANTMPAPTPRFGLRAALVALLAFVMVVSAFLLMK